MIEKQMLILYCKECSSAGLEMKRKRKNNKAKEKRKEQRLLVPILNHQLATHSSLFAALHLAYSPRDI